MIDQYQVLRTKLAVFTVQKNTLALAEFSEPSNDTMLNKQLLRQFTRTGNEKVSFFDHTFLSLLHVKPRCAPRLPNNLCFDQDLSLQICIFIDSTIKNTNSLLNIHATKKTCSNVGKQISHGQPRTKYVIFPHFSLGNKTV